LLLQLLWKYFVTAIGLDSVNFVSIAAFDIVRTKNDCQGCFATFCERQIKFYFYEVKLLQGKELDLLTSE
jgi:hypothetical protein